MKNTFILIFLSSSILSFGQKRNIELSDIWASGTFYPKTVNGFVNMNDGKSYCIQEKNNKGSDAINQYDYVTGEKIKELFITNSLIFLFLSPKTNNNNIGSNVSFI